MRVPLITRVDVGLRYCKGVAKAGHMGVMTDFVKLEDEQIV